MSIPSLRQCNNVLSLVVLLFAAYILVAPFWPALTFYWRHHVAAEQVTPPTQSATVSRPNPQAIPKDNTLVIPGLGMTELINEGSDSRTLRKGVWRRPATSTPDKGGNTVLVGHRFTYASGAAVFYHLDAVHVDDPITLYWQGKQYDYTVIKTFVVKPTQVSIEANTEDPILTIYTCTPLWTAKDRLVIQAKLVGGVR